MAERTVSLPSLPPHFGRWLLAPAILGALAALVAATAAGVRRRARQPALPRMSSEWLRNHDAEAGHRSEFWSERW